MARERLTSLDFFANELRCARAAMGMSQEQLGQAISYSPSLIAMVETAKRTPSQDFAVRCDEILKVNGLLSRILEDLIRRETTPEWFRPWVELENEATVIRSFEPLVVPGLLQTEAYARALLSADPTATAEEIDHRLAARLERQEILLRSDPPMLIVVIDHSVLHRKVADPVVMRDQLLALVQDRRRVEIQVLPDDVGAHPGLNGPLVIASFADSDEVAYVEGQLGGRVLERREDRLSITQVWETLRGEAMSRTRSEILIKEVIQKWT